MTHIGNAMTHINADFKPLDLTLNEMLLAYIKSYQEEYESPWQRKLRTKIYAELIKVGK